MTPQMTLCVESPAGYEAERRYILDVVLGDWLGLDWELRTTARRGDVRITLTGDGVDGGGGTPGRCVLVPDILFGTPEGDWLSPRSLPATPLRVREVGDPGSTALQAGQRLPVIYGRPEQRFPDESGVALDVDVFGSAFFMLTRYEEVVVPDRGSYDRFPAASSLAAREGFLSSPIVDAYVELLWAACKRVWPTLRRAPREYSVLLTHDVDDPLASIGRTPAFVARELAGDLVRRRDLRVAGRRARSVLAARRGDYRFDPHNTYDFLMDVGERAGIRCAFYFLGHRSVTESAPTTHQLAHPAVQALVGAIGRRGHEVGFHGGFGTYLDPVRTKEEFDYLHSVAERQGVRQQRWGGRQHYLQWANPHTWRNWHDAGLAYDATLCYAESPGLPDRHLPRVPGVRPAGPAGADAARGSVPDHGHHPVRLPVPAAERGGRDGAPDRRRMPPLCRFTRHALAQRRADDGTRAAAVRRAGRGGHGSGLSAQTESLSPHSGDQAARYSGSVRGICDFPSLGTPFRAFFTHT